MSLPGGHKGCALWSFRVDRNGRTVCTNMVVMKMHLRAWRNSVRKYGYSIRGDAFG